jgi:hypothetical protein
MSTHTSVSSYQLAQSFRMHERLDAYCDCNQYIGPAVIAASAVIRLYKQLTTAAAACLAKLCSAVMMSMKTVS